MLISQDDSENVSLFQQVLGHGIVYASGLFGELNSWQHLWRSLILSPLPSDPTTPMDIEMGSSTLNRKAVRLEKKISFSLQSSSLLNQCWGCIGNPDSRCYLYSIWSKNDYYLLAKIAAFINKACGGAFEPLRMITPQAIFLCSGPLDLFTRWIFSSQGKQMDLINTIICCSWAS